MQNYTSIIGASGRLNIDDPRTWDVTTKLERVSKIALLNNRLDNLKFVSDPRVRQYERSKESETTIALKAKLKDIHEWTWERLGLKAEALKGFDFRVLVGSDEAITPTQKSSHICLSYNWWSDQWLESGAQELWGLSPALRVDPANMNFDIPETELPITDAMWNAFLAERDSDLEGVWVDQLCVDQTNPAEVKNILLLMERIYRTARKVVVPLENVLMYSDEVQAILNHIRIINSVPVEQRKDWRSWARSADLLTLGASAYALLKIEGSRWFRRVWCHHELRMGNDFVFVVPVVERVPADNHKEYMNVMKLDCKALTTLVASCREMVIGTGLTHHEIMLQSFLQMDVSQNGQPRSFIPATILAPNFDKFTPERELWSKARGKVNENIPMMRILRELLAYRAQRPEDVFHVLLNIAAPGLMYVGEREPLSLADIVFMANVVAIASGDVSPLIACADLRLWQSNEITSLPRSAYSWAAYPSSTSVGWRGNPGRVRNGLDYKITDLGLQIPVLVVGSSTLIPQMQDLDLELPPEYSNSIANVLKVQRDIIARDPTAATGWNQVSKRTDKTEEPPEIDPNYVRNYAEAMVFASACGADWMTECVAELSQLGLLPDDIDILGQQEAFSSMWESDDARLRTFDYGDDVESETYQKLSKLWPGFKDYIAFFDALLHFLIGDDWRYRDKPPSQNLRLSLMTSYSEDGNEWFQLLSLPDKQTAGDYWLVRPSVAHNSARPDRAEHNGVDLRWGGTWAVQAVSMRSTTSDEVDVLDAERAMSTDIWFDPSAPASQDDIDRHVNETVELKIISRSVRMFPTGVWQEPKFGKMAIVHG